MTKPKGKPGPPKGTPKVPNSGGSRRGIPNKSTARAKEALAAFVDNNADRLQGWLDQIAEVEGPKEAFRAFTDLLEYHVPKLARTEHTGPEGGPQEHLMSIAILPVKPRE